MVMSQLPGTHAATTQDYSAELSFVNGNDQNTDDPGLSRVKESEFASRLEPRVWIVSSNMNSDSFTSEVH